MRFVILVKATPETEAGTMPASELIAALGKYNEALIDAGVLLHAEGPMSSARGARIRLEAGQTLVTDGPFEHPEQLLAGFWLIQTRTREEAIEWCRRIPLADGEEVELRQLFEAMDFPIDGVTEDHLRREREWRAANQRPVTR